MNAVRTILLSAASLACVAAMPSFANASYRTRVNTAQRQVIRQENQLNRAVNREIRTVRPVNNRAVVRVRV